MRMRTSMLAAVLLASLLVACAPTAGGLFGSPSSQATVEECVSPEQAAVIADAQLRGRIGQAVGLGSAELTCGDLEQLTELTAVSAGITSLEGLQNASNLTSLNLLNNSISDLSPLEGLTGLQELRLSINPIRDLSPLSGLGSLTSLRIEQIPGDHGLDFVTGLTSLEELYLSGTRLFDISPLTALPNLRLLTTGNDAVTDYTPLASLNSLEFLQAFNLPTRNIELLLDLTNLQTLTLIGPQGAVSDAAILAGMNQLTTLGLYITEDFDTTALADMQNLTELQLYGNTVELDVIVQMEQLQTLGVRIDGSMARLAQLQNLHTLNLANLNDYRISDPEVLADFPHLTHLTLFNNNLTDISFLAGLTGLQWLDVSGNYISDPSPLIGLTNLQTLNFRMNCLAEDISRSATLSQLQENGTNVVLAPRRPAAQC